MRPDRAGLPVARHRRRAPSSDARRFGWSSVVGIVLSAGAFSWMVTGGTFAFFRSLPFSNFYDVQARALLHGTWSVPASAVSIEGIRTDGHTDMYYGPVPALLHLPVLLVTHRLDGRLTEPSLLIGFIVALVFASLLSWRVRVLLRGAAPLGWAEAVATAGFICVVGIGSVLLFLGTTAQVYEEAEMWGAALTLGAFFCVLGFIERPGARRLVSAGVMITAALLTRGSVGIGPWVALLGVAAIFLLSVLAERWPRVTGSSRWLAQHSGLEVPRNPRPLTAGLGAALGIPVALYVVINEMKFHTLVSIPLNHQVYSLEDAHRQAVLAANGGSLFGLKFLPTNLVAFLRPDAITITRLFPWVFFPSRAHVFGNVLYDTRDWTSSVPASMPVLFVLALVGIFMVFVPARRGAARHSPEHAAVVIAGGRSEVERDADTSGVDGGSAPFVSGLARLRLPLIGAAASTIGILVIAFIAQRYLADAMPVVVIGALAGWHVMAAKLTGASRAVRIGALVALCVFGAAEMWTNASLSLFYQRALGSSITIPERASLVSLQERIDAHLFGGRPPGVHEVSRLPASGHVLDLAVVGSCAGVYQFDGTRYEPVELGRHGGALRLKVRFDQAHLFERQPLVVSGGSSPEDVIAVTWVGGDRYAFSYYFAQRAFGLGQRWYDESAVAISPTSSHVVSIDLVTGIGQISIWVDGTSVFSLIYPVAPPTVVRLGSAPPSVPTTRSFAGEITPLAVPTPICDQLERRR